MRGPLPRAARADCSLHARARKRCVCVRAQVQQGGGARPSWQAGEPTHPDDCSDPAAAPAAAFLLRSMPGRATLALGVSALHGPRAPQRNTQRATCRRHATQAGGCPCARGQCKQPGTRRPGRCKQPTQARAGARAKAQQRRRTFFPGMETRQAAACIPATRATTAATRGRSSPRPRSPLGAGPACGAGSHCVARRPRQAQQRIARRQSNKQARV